MPAQQERARTRRQKILDAAASVFADRGYRAAAMDDVARAAETSKGGLYFHFPGKEAILLALLDRTAQLLRTRVESAMAAETDPVARAEAALGVLLRTMSRHRKLARIFAIEAMGAGGRFSERALAIQDDFAALIATELDAAIDAGAIEPIDTRVASQAWVGTLHAVLVRWLLSGDGATHAKLDESYDTIRAMLFRSVGASPLPATTAPDRSRP